MHLGIEKLPKNERIKVRKILKRVETLEEIQMDLETYDRESLLEVAGALDDEHPPGLVGRLIREIAECNEAGCRTATRSDVTSILKRLGQVHDPVLAGEVGSRTLGGTGLSRVGSDQLLFRDDYLLDSVRATSLMFDPTNDSLLGRTGWTQILGIGLPEFIGGVLMLTKLASTGRINETEIEAYAEGDADVLQTLRSTVECLETDLSALEPSGLSPNQRLYELGPLAANPIIRLGSGDLLVPSVTHLRMTISLSSLYIRLVRQDSQSRTRERTTLVGKHLEEHMFHFAQVALGEGWTVLDLDDEPASGSKVSDVAVWPADRSFLLIIEAKSNLSTAKAQLGQATEVAKMVSLYQSAFDQISSSVSSIGSNSFMSDAPTKIPVFGLACTLDDHHTTIREGSTHFGMILPATTTVAPGTTDPTPPCRVISSSQVELLLDAAGALGSEAALRVLTSVFDKDAPARAIASAVRLEVEKQPFQNLPSEVILQQQIKHLVESLRSDKMREAVRTATLR